MKAMVLEEIRTPLKLLEVPTPEPGAGQVLIRVHACGVCRTDLHLVDGELPDPKLPLILGHQIVGTVVSRGPEREQPGESGEAHRLEPGERVGVPWLGYTDGTCNYCRTGRENLCDNARFTGYQIDGGYAEYTVADERFCFPLPPGYPDLQAAPLLCAGLIGYRSLSKARENPDLQQPGGRLGIYGFGSAAHIIAQVARHQGMKLYAFTRPGDSAGQAFAREMGADWVGPSDELPPEQLHSAIIFAPAGELVPAALRALAKGGQCVCGGIHMSDIPGFPYSILWGERSVVSVANLTRRDGQDFLHLAPRIPIKSHVRPYPLEETNEALEDLRHGRLEGSAVIVMPQVSS